ncbi:Elongation factor P [Serratia symbiotica]|nr:Elongation factor P [Serratia symbiotica]
MTNYSSNDFRADMKIIFEGEPYKIESSEFVKPGKGQAFTRVKMRRILTGTRLEKTFKSTAFFKKADIIDLYMNYLYYDNNFYYFMHPITFEQYQINKKIISNKEIWLQDNVKYMITLWNKNPIFIQIPNFIKAKIINTHPNFKGDTIKNNNKLATLNTGFVIKVPLFIQIGEIIRIDTRNGEYISRVK